LTITLAVELGMFGVGIIEIIVLVAVLASLALAALLVGIMLFRGTQRSGTTNARPMISHSPALVESDGTLRIEMPLGPDWADRWVRVVVEPGDRV
jgi:hypothetical protein